MVPRLASVPDHSFFLFGPRATCKTTWLRRHLEEDFLSLIYTDGFYGV